MIISNEGGADHHNNNNYYNNNNNDDVLLLYISLYSEDEMRSFFELDNDFFLLIKLEFLL